MSANTSQPESEFENIEKIKAILQNAPAPASTPKYATKSSKPRGRPARKGNAPELNNQQCRYILPNELQELISGLITEMREMKASLISVRREFSTLIISVESLKKENESLKQELKQSDLRIKQLEEKAVNEPNVDLKHQLMQSDLRVKELEERADRREKMERAHDIVISSDKISKLPDAYFIRDAIRITSSTLKIPPQYLSQFRCKQIGHENGKKRALFTIPDVNFGKAMFNNARRIKPKGFFINESLIPSRENLFYEARKMKKDSNSKCSIYTSLGEVYGRKHGEADPVHITSAVDILAIL